MNGYIATYLGQQIAVRGDSIEEAADHAARRLVGKGHVMRVTGSPGLSGMFQVYRIVPTTGGLTSYGGNIHVR